MLQDTEPDTASHPHFHRRDLVLCAAVFALGILLAYRFEGIPALIAVCLFACFGAAALFLRKSLAAMLLFALAAGMLRMAVFLPALPEEGSYALVGTLAESPAVKEGGVYTVLYDVSLDAVPLRGRVLLRMPAAAEEKLHAGDTVSVDADIRIPEKMPEESFDPRAYYLSEGITAHGYAQGMPRELSHRIGPDYRLSQLRGRIDTAVISAFGTEAPLAFALLLNDKTCLSEDAKEAFRTAGVAHILALSGLHVSIFISVFSALFPKRLPRVRFFLVAVFLAAYCILADFAPSLLRASIMALLRLGAPLAKKRYDPLSALAASLLAILFFTPAGLFSIGLQLSFTATAAIFLLRKPFYDLLLFLPEKLRASLALTLSGTSGTFPLTLLHFGQLPLYTLAANLLIVPMMAVLLPLLLIGTAAAFFSPDALWCAVPAKHLLFLLRRMTEEFASLPFALLYFDPPPAYALYPLYGSMLMLSPFHLRPRSEKLLASSAFLALSALLLFLSRFPA